MGKNDTQAAVALLLAATADMTINKLGVSLQAVLIADASSAAQLAQVHVSQLHVPEPSELE